MLINLATLEKSLMENFIFCAVLFAKFLLSIIVFNFQMNQSVTVSCQILFPVTSKILPTPQFYLKKKSFKEKNINLSLISFSINTSKVFIFNIQNITLRGFCFRGQRRISNFIKHLWLSILAKTLSQISLQCLKCASKNN